MEEYDVMKKKVHDFWDQASCGEELYLTGTDRLNMKITRLLDTTLKES